MSTTPSRRVVDSIVGAPFDPQTYRNLAYLLLAGPIGLLSFVVLSVGVSLTVGLSLTLLGPVALLATLLVALTLSWLDVRLTGHLLGVDFAGPSFPSDDGGAVAYVVELVRNRDTWVGAVYLCWRSLFGLVAFVSLTTGASLAAGLLAAPLTYDGTLVVNSHLGVWNVNTLPRALTAAGVGLLVGFGTLLLTNLLAGAGRSVAAHLFGAADGPAPSDG